MFTGIIEAQKRVAKAASKGGNRTVTIEKPNGWKIALGQSISVDGICSTVVEKNAKTFSVTYMPETLSKTTAGDFVKGYEANLERSLTLQTLVDGHLVQGHIDSCAKVVDFKKDTEGHLLTIALPKKLLPFVALHGSVAINGVSLTIAGVRGNHIRVALIPHTLAHTNLRALKKGSMVNVETDMIARYVAQYMSVVQ